MQEVRYGGRRVANAVVAPVVSAVAAFAGRLTARDALVRYIVYSPDDGSRCVRLHDEGAIPQRLPQILFLLGSHVEHRGAAGRTAPRRILEEHAVTIGVRRRRKRGARQDDE